ncbi:MAG: hypothetical protein ACETWB_02750 [Anaerolineae bacterium]
MDFRDKISGAQSELEKLVGSIPGFKGYRDREMRRDADKLLREQLATRFDEQRRKLSDLQTQLIGSGQLEFVDDLEGAVMKLQTVIDRLKTASYGYAGFFDAIKVNEEQLDTLYAFDNALMSEVEKVAAGIDKVSSAISAKKRVAEAIVDLRADIQSVNDTLGRREEAILQV